VVEFTAKDSLLNKEEITARYQRVISLIEAEKDRKRSAIVSVPFSSCFSVFKSA
jgi:hypothetical protein